MEELKFEESLSYLFCFVGLVSGLLLWCSYWEVAMMCSCILIPMIWAIEKEILDKENREV